MATTVTVSGSSYSVPAEADENWADEVSNLLIALSTSTKVLQNTGGNFSLTSEVDFGASYGLKSIYFKSRTTNPASTGEVRLARADTVTWRNEANDGDIELGVNSSDLLTYNGTSLQNSLSVTDTSRIDLTLASDVLSADIISDSITNTHINSAAAIEYSKLNLTGGIVNADIASGAAIALDKLEAIPAGYVLVSSAGGVIEESTMTATDAYYLASITSSVQPQLDSKLPLAGGTMTGDLVLAGDPDANLKAATKQYVDNRATTAEDLSNKTFTDAIILQEQGSTPSTPSSGDKKFYAKTDGKIYTLDDAGNEIEVGSGAGGGSKNYFDETNSKFESGYGDWVTDDGAGSTANYLTRAETSSATYLVAGSKSLLLTKNSNDASGEFFKVALETIDPTDRGKPLFGSFSYNATDPTYGNYASGDLIVEVYDSTNAAVLYSGPSADLEIPASKGRFTFVVYTEETTAAIEFRIKINSTNASTYEVAVDEFKLGPAAQITAPVITEWQEYTLTIGAVTTAPTTGTVVQNHAKWRRVGDSMEIQYTYYQSAGGSAGSGAYLFPLPSGYTIDTSKMPGSLSFGTFPVVGSAGIYASSEGSSVGYVEVYDSTKLQIVAIEDTGATVRTAGSSNYDLADTDVRYSFEATVPISNWSSGALVTENELSLQTVRVTGASNGGNSAGTGTDITFTEVTDSHSTWNGTQFTAPATGTYEFQGFVNWNTPSAIELYAYIDGVRGKIAGYSLGTSVSTLEFHWKGSLNKGEVWSLRPSATITLSASSDLHWINISSVPDYTVLGAVSERNRIQTNILTSDKTSDGTISDLTFSNLTIGRWYEITGSILMYIDNGASDTYVAVDATHDSSVIHRSDIQITESTDTGIDAVHYSLAFKFKATATSLTFVASSLSSGSVVKGNSTRAQTYVQLEERNDLIETDVF